MESKPFFGQKDLYRFRFLSDQQRADNLIQNWREEPGEAYEVSSRLVGLVEEMYARAIVTDEEGE